MDAVNRIYAAFAAGNIPAVLELFDPAIEWFAAENSPLADRSPYRGLNQVVEGVSLESGSSFRVWQFKWMNSSTQETRSSCLDGIMAFAKPLERDSMRKSRTSGRSLATKPPNFNSISIPTKWLKPQ
jgi:hypothetical protein